MKNPSFMNRFLSFKSTTLPRILATLTTDIPELKKKAMKTLVSVATSETQEKRNFLPMVRFVVDHKKEILADQTNIAEITKEFGEDKNGGILLRLLLN